MGNKDVWIRSSDGICLRSSDGVRLHAWLINLLPDTRVMLMGTLVYGIRYSFPEYVCTLLVVGGVSIFALLNPSSKSISKLAHPNPQLGYGLCFLNLAFDGFTNATQESITARQDIKAQNIQSYTKLQLLTHQALAIFMFANQAGLDMLETTLVALQDIMLDKILDEAG